MNEPSRPCIFLLVLLAVLWLPGTAGLAQQIMYTEVEIPISNGDDWDELLQSNVDLDHYFKTDEGNVRLVVEERDMILLNEANIAYRVLHEDLQTYYGTLLSSERSLQDLKADCGLENFSLGSMGGYLTYSEIMTQLSLMRELYPQYVSTIDTIGLSFEGQMVPAIKLSDDPNEDQSDIEAVVYFESLTHAREPNSMMVLIYYMWWILENAEQNPEIQYLLENREIYFVPVVNVDGYLYNEEIAPGGGGMWRKSRKINEVDESCWGVDLNRNYGNLWGMDIGSSGDPCSPTYRGETPFSEIESQNVRDFVAKINPALAFSNHSYGNKFMNPLSPVDSLVDYESYSEFSSEFTPYTYKGYGLVSEMLNYYSSGTTRDYLHGQGIYAWTPEIGESFWPLQSEICPIAQTFLKSLRYATWVAGDYTKIISARLKESEFLETNQPGLLSVAIRNRGISKAAREVEVELLSQDSLVTITQPILTIDSLPARSSLIDVLEFEIFRETGLQPSEEVQFELIIRQEGVETDRQALSFYTAAPSSQILFSDDAEQGMGQWISNGAPGWDTTFVDAVSGAHCFADSRYGNYLPFSSSYIEMKDAVDLTQSSRPILEFQAKWALEYGLDEVAVELIDELGFKVHLGQYCLTSGPEPPANNFTGHRHWQNVRYDLGQFRDQLIKIRITIYSDNMVQSDGFFFDDIKIMDLGLEFPVQGSDLKETSVLSIFPNPTNQLVSLYIGKDLQEFERWELWSFSGQLIQQSPILEELSTIDLKDRAAGVYLLVVRGKTTSLVEKVTVLHH